MERGLEGYTKCSVLPKAHTGMHIFTYMSAPHTYTLHLLCVQAHACTCVWMRMMMITVNCELERMEKYQASRPLQ